MFAAGQSIGSYRILQKIGTGGMGAVYLAEHPLIGKRVALKVIHRELASNKEVVQRFFQEAKAVTRIGNEHIISVHDFGQTPDGDHFYIMEYLEGQTLAQVLARDHVLDVFRALHISAQMASALAAAHAAGVIHRDLKPDNVMLTTRLGDPDFVVLLDFGLAKMFVGSGEQSAVKTAAGVLLGTPQFMSPEACESRSTVDHRTDVYALGILLFQMTTGKLPFDGETMSEVLIKQVTQLPPPPRGFNPSIPPSVEQIVLRCLAKNVDARFPTMMSLREALLDPETYLMKQPPMAPTRSMAPGEMQVDGKMVMAYAAAEQAAKRRTAGMQHQGLVLPKADEHARTMIHEGPLPLPPRSPTGPVPIVVPAMPKMNTMRIATPLGYSSRPARKMWPLVLIFALLLGLGGGAFAVAWFGRDSKGASTKAAGPLADAATGGAQPGSSVTADRAGSGGPAAAAIDAGSVVSVTPDPAAVPSAAGSASGSATENDRPTATDVTMAVIVFDTTPPGAEIIGPDKKSHGTTPAKLSLPISDMPLEFELRLAGYRKKTKQLVVKGNSSVQVTLDKMPAKTRTVPTGTGSTVKRTGKGTGTGTKKRRGGDGGAMRPE